MLKKLLFLIKYLTTIWTALALSSIRRCDKKLELRYTYAPPDRLGMADAPLRVDFLQVSVAIASALSGNFKTATHADLAIASAFLCVTN